MIFLSFLQGLDLRVEHTHGLNKEKCQGGHYHYDITPEVIEYTGYFNLAECKKSYLKVIIIRDNCKSLFILSFSV